MTGWPSWCEAQPGEATEGTPSRIYDDMKLGLNSPITNLFTRRRNEGDSGSNRLHKVLKMPYLSSPYLWSQCNRRGANVHISLPLCSTPSIRSRGLRGGSSNLSRVRPRYRLALGLLLL